MNKYDEYANGILITDPYFTQANEAWIDAMPIDDVYQPCPCGCGMKFKFAIKELGLHELRFIKKYMENLKMQSANSK